MSKDEFFNQPMFQLSQTNLRDLERSVSPREIIPKLDEVPESNSHFSELIQGQIDLSLASSNNPTTVMELDLDGNIKYLSKNWEIIVGTKVRKMLNKPISNFIIGNNEDDLKVFNYAIEHMLQDDDSYKVRFVTATNDQVPEFDENITPNNSMRESLTDVDFIKQEAENIEKFNNQLKSDSNKQESQVIDIDDYDESQTSSEVSNDGDIIELEAQGILIHDSKTNVPTHLIWTLKPYILLDLDLTISDRLIDLLGFGSTIFENYLLDLKDLKITDESLVPQPQTVLCRICEQQIPAWFLEKHSDLCIVEHRTSEDLQLCHDLISDQKDEIVRIFDSLYQNSYSQMYSGQPNSSLSSLSSSSSASLITEYKGLPLPTSVSTDQVNIAHHQKALPLKRFPFGILSRLIELCDEALTINPIEISEDGEPKFSPHTEKSINTILNFKPFETSDKAIKQIIQDTQELINDKIDTLLRLYSILKISEKIKKQVDELVLASVVDTVNRIKEQVYSNLNSISNSALNSPIDLNSPLHLTKFINSPLNQKFSPSALHQKLLSPQPVKSPYYQYELEPPATTGTDLHPSASQVQSITPKDILLRGRSSIRTSSFSSLSSSKSRRGSNALEDLQNMLFRSDSMRSDSPRNVPSSVPIPGNSSTYSTYSGLGSNSNYSGYSHTHGASSLTAPNSGTANSGHFFSPSHNLSSLQRNTPNSSPLVSHPQLHLDSLDRPNLSNRKPPLSPLLVSQTPLTKPSAGSIKDYEVLKAISKGAFGSVFLAKRKITGDYVAIKCLKKSDMIAKNQILNVKSERAVMMKQTDSPYVAQLYSSFQSNNYLYLVMEYLNGGNCATLLKMLGTLGDDWTRRYIAEVIVGITDLHHRGIIHRDLKPDNLLIDSKGHLKLTDFGLSRVGVVGRQTQRKESTTEHGMELFRKPAGGNGGSSRLGGSPKIDSDFHKRTSYVTPFSLSPNVENTKCSTTSSPASDRLEKDSMRDSQMSRSGSRKYDSPMLNATIPRNSSETSFLAVDDVFHVSPSQSNEVVSYKLFDPKESSDIKFVGTPDYLAPETIKGVGQSEASDWWSIGCIMFEFLFGYPPFHASTPQQVFTNILIGEIDWPSLPQQEFDEICSPAAKDLIQKLLTVSPEERLGYEGSDEIKLHPYFKGIDWENLFNEIPLFIPNTEDPESIDYFDQRGADILQFPKDDSESDEEKLQKDKDPKLELPDTNHSDASRTSVSTSSTNTSRGGSTSKASVPLINTSSSDSRRGSITGSGKRERRGSKLADPSEFGSFHFRNLNVLEKANKDVINRLKNEHLEHRNSFSSSSSESTPIRSRGFSFGTEKPNLNLNLSTSSSVGLGLGAPSSSGSNPGSMVQNQSYFGPPIKDSSPFKRPVSPMLTAFNRAPSPMKDLGSPQSFKHERLGSGHSSDDIPDFGKLSPSEAGTVRHRSSVNSLARSFKDSPNSSDTEDNTKALIRIQKRRESSRRQLVNVNELDILYCEPIPIVRHVVMNYFEQLGCIVVLVNDGDELIRRATGQVKFDIIFTALKLPKIEGIDAVKLIRHTNGVNSATPLVAITSFAKEAQLSGQFNEVIEKPVDLDTIRQCINKLRSDEAIESDTEK